MFRFAFAFLLISTAAHAQQQSSAYDALLVVGKQFSRSALNRIISVTGVDGDPQPRVWSVLISDRRAPGGVRELQVANGQIVANRTPNAAGARVGSAIKTAQLNLDSSGAFAVASHTADQAHTNFDRVAYTLRANDRGIPVWIVTIQNQARQPLGTIHMSANRGNVTRVEGMYHGANMAQVEQDPAQQLEPVNRGRPEEHYADADVQDEGEVEASDGDENVVKVEIKRLFRRTKHDARRLFGRVRSSFDDFAERHRLGSRE
ncbi:MAG: hypothetical protein ACR2F0_04085 [Chthoniobacterales bacterium]